MAGRPFLPGRGRNSWGEAPGGGSYGQKWYEKLDMLEEPKNKDQPKEIRPVGGVFSICQHFIRFIKKDGTRSGYYELCPDFNPLTGLSVADDERRCPVCADFKDSELPEELRFYPSFRHYFDAFDIDLIRAGAVTNIFGVVWTNKYGKEDMVKISNTLGAGVHVDDLELGHSVSWYFNKKAKDNKDRVSFVKGSPYPIKYDEKRGLFGIRVPVGGGYKVVTGEPTPFDTLIEVQSANEIRRSLKRLGLYDRLSDFRAHQPKHHQMPHMPKMVTDAPVSAPEMPDPAAQRYYTEKAMGSYGVPKEDIVYPPRSVVIPPTQPIVPEQPPMESPLATTDWDWEATPSAAESTEAKATFDEGAASTDWDWGDNSAATPKKTAPELEVAGSSDLDSDFFGDDSSSKESKTAAPVKATSPAAPADSWGFDDAPKTSASSSDPDPSDGWNFDDEW